MQYPDVIFHKKNHAASLRKNRNFVNWPFNGDKPPADGKKPRPKPLPMSLLTIKKTARWHAFATAIAVLALVSAGLAAFRGDGLFRVKSVSAATDTLTTDTLPVGIRKLLQAYPEHLVRATANAIVWKDGTVMPYDDGVAGKDYDALLNSPDLQDQMQKQYPKGKDFPDPTANVTDTSRIRYTPFFEKMYGQTREQVAANLTYVRWLPGAQKAGTQKIRMAVTRVNGVHKHLQAISDELEQRPDLLTYVRNPGGAFNWRSIRGTDRRSAHSFGIAVDINVKYANYWLWDRELKRPHKYTNRYPLEIIEIFEKHGFIWGGKWYYYDTMHFEYRPELLTDTR